MPATDIISLTDAQQVLSLDDTSDHEPELAGLITAISTRIDGMCGPVVQRTVTGEVHDGGREFVKLDVDYAQSASSVVEWRNTTSTTLTAETNAAKTANDYMLDDRGQGVVLLRRRSLGNDVLFPPGRRNIVVTYTAGRYANTGQVDQLFKRAATFMLTHLFKSTAPVWHTTADFLDVADTPGTAVPGFAVPRLVTEMLADHMRVPASFGRL